MEVILLEKIKHLGNLGDKVKVKPGYGRNYLIPQGKAAPATPDNIAEFEARRAEFEKAQEDTLIHAKARASRLEGLTVVIAGKVSAEGKLYGSVGTSDIAQAVTTAGVEIARQEVRLPTGPIRQIGEYNVTIHLHADVDVTVKIQIISEE